MTSTNGNSESGLIFRSGPRKLASDDIVNVAIGHDGIVSDRYPLAKDTIFGFDSYSGGLVPPNTGRTPYAQNHYGQVAFEGERVYDTLSGLGMPAPWANVARFWLSTERFFPGREMIIQEWQKHPDFLKLEFSKSFTAEELYDRAEGIYFGEDDELSRVSVVLRGKVHVIKERCIFTATDSAGRTTYEMRDMTAIPLILAFTNGLVTLDYFPEIPEMVVGGYARRWGTPGNTLGLKVSTLVPKQNGGFLVKPLDFGLQFLPWGRYLDEGDYERGLSVLISPYLRDKLDRDAKLARGYNAREVHLAFTLGFGETLAMNLNHEVVEGSAENIFVIKHERSSFVAYTPPIGAGCLPGTNRYGVIKTLETMGIKTIFKALPLEEMKNALGVLLTGTGAQLIHVRSITDGMKAVAMMPALGRGCLRSEDVDDMPRVLKKDDLVRPNPLLINGGEKHSIIDTIQRKFRVWQMEHIVPVTAIRFSTIEKLFGVETRDFATKAQREDEAAGRFDERRGSKTHKNQLEYNTKEMAKILMMALRKSEKPGIKTGLRRVERLGGRMRVSV